MGCCRVPRPMFGCGGGCFLCLGCFSVCVGMGRVGFYLYAMLGWVGWVSVSCFCLKIVKMGKVGWGRRDRFGLCMADKFCGSGLFVLVAITFKNKRTARKVFECFCIGRHLVVRKVSKRKTDVCELKGWDGN